MTYKRAVLIDGVSTGDDWVLTKTEVENPEAKTFTAEVDGRDGVIDFTEYMGGVKFENRKVTVDLLYYGTGWRVAYQKIRRACHGRVVQLTHPDFDGVFIGRGDVQMDEYSANGCSVEIEFDCNPYRFLYEITYRANCAGGVWLTLPCGDKPQIPVFDSEYPIRVVFDGVQYELPPGSHRVPEIELVCGDNDVYIDSYLEPGNTTWGDLEAYTYEQLAERSYSWWRWRDEPPQTRASWSNMEAHTWEELGGKTYQEWYWSNGDGVVRDVFIQYDMEEL